MKRYLNLYAYYMKNNFKSLMMYRVDFLVGSIGFVITMVGLLISLFVIFQFVDQLGGWNQNEILILFAFVSLARALWDTFMYNMIFLEQKIKTGQLDILLTRPVNPLFQLIAEKWDPDTVGEVFFSLILFVICGVRVGIFDDLFFWISFPFLLISSILCFAAIHL
ncbi:hypothetical protein FY526_24275, partial [Clostridioides difficile]